jgi:ketosteroid isomerase-like protein
MEPVHTWISRLLAAAVLAVAAAGCAGGAAKENGFTSADVTAIKDTTKAFAAAVSGHNTADVLAYYPEHVVFMPPNSGTIRGKEWLKGYYDMLLGSGGVSLSLEPRDVSGHGPLAYENGNYTMITRGENGEESRDRGKYLFVLRKFNGKWLYEYAMWNSDLPKPMITAAQASAG